jgi:hypothetical protein
MVHDDIRSANRNPSHACKQVATGRQAPTSPDANHDRNICIGDSDVPLPGADAEGSDDIRSANRNPSHACHQVATGRWNPTSPGASYDQNIRTGDSDVPLPGADAEGSDGIRSANTNLSHACQQVETGRWNPTSPGANHDRNICIGDSDVPLPGADAEGSDDIRSANRNPSHACQQVATGRQAPTSPGASYDQNIRTGNSDVPPPGADAEGSDDIRSANTNPSHACKQVATGRWSE